jgi:outer membrane protein TolC
MGLTLRYNLFNGFADSYNLKLASSNYEMQRFTARAAKQDIILNVKNNFIQYLKSSAQLSIAEETVELLESQKKIAEVSFEVGVLSRSDVLLVDVQLASTRLQLLNAQIAVRLARQQLEYLIGRAILESENVEKIDFAAEYNIPDINVLYRMLEDNRSELRYAKLAHTAATYTTKAGEGGFMPKLNIYYNLGWYGDDFNPLSGRETEYDAIRTIGVGVSWNLFQGFYDMNTKKANIQNEYAAAFALSDMRKTLKLQVSNAYQMYFSSKELLTVAKVGVEQAQESYRVMRNMYENNEATTTDLLDASLALNNALNSLTSANYDLIAAVSQIERSVETDLLGINVPILYD